MTPAAIEVLRAGPLSTVQDLGRPGFAHLGVGASGAADPGALALANRVAGNDVSAAGIEMTLGGLAVRFLADAVVALAGAACDAQAGEAPVPMGTAVAVAAGTVLRVGSPARGLRTYLAVRGGVDVLPILGSRSTDTLSGLGPSPLRRGMRLGLGSAGSWAEAAVPPPGRLEDAPSLAVLPGPRDGWFTDEAMRRLLDEPFTVTARSDRVGLRLDGPVLSRAHDGELPPEPVVTGALQVPPSGGPILFLADHPVTGGYPVIAVVTTADIGTAAQLRPGRRLRFHRAPAL